MQQKVGRTIEPLAYFVAKLTCSKKHYITFRRAALAVNTDAKHFRHLLEGRHSLHRSQRANLRSTWTISYNSVVVVGT